MISENTKFGSLRHFFLKNTSPFDLIFSVIVCFSVNIYVCEMNSGIFFLVMVAIETRKMVLLWFPWQQLLREKIIYLFQKTIVDKDSLRVSAQSNHYFLRKNVATRPIALFTWTLDPSNGLVTARKWVKTLLFPNVYMLVMKKHFWHIYFLYFTTHMGHFSHEGCSNILKRR